MVLPDLAATLAFHDFERDRGSRPYGQEWDAQLSFQPGPFVVTVKYADYDAHGFQVDVRKAWVQLSWTSWP